jgi:hypothetical protein
MQCDDGICIPASKWCDRRRDCPGTPSDELHCEHVTRRDCSPFEFECGNSVCLPRKFMCDGDNDCGDNSGKLFSFSNQKAYLDETNEQCKTALCEPPLRFRCAHSRLCLNILQLCNGVNDCGENDLSDEHLRYIFKTKLKFPTYSMCSSFSEYGDCSSDEFKCANAKCIIGNLTCNRNDDCGDQSGLHFFP